MKYSRFTSGLDEKAFLYIQKCTILDWYGDRVEGIFYETELQAMNVDPSTEYHIEKISKRCVRNKQKEVLVCGYTGPRSTKVGYQKQM